MHRRGVEGEGGERSCLFYGSYCWHGGTMHYVYCGDYEGGAGGGRGMGGVERLTEWDRGRNGGGTGKESEGGGWWCGGRDG